MCHKQSVLICFFLLTGFWSKHMTPVLHAAIVKSAFIVPEQSLLQANDSGVGGDGGSSKFACHPHTRKEAYSYT